MNESADYFLNSLIYHFVYKMSKKKSKDFTFTMTSELMQLDDWLVERKLIWNSFNSQFFLSFIKQKCLKSLVPAS